MNKVILSGRITKDIELMKTQSGISVVSNSIAVRRDFKENGEYQTDFINFVAWRTQADYLASYAKKGDRCEIIGRWQVRTYQAQDGSQRKVDEVVVESINVFSTQPKEQEPAQPTYNPYDTYNNNVGNTNNNYNDFDFNDDELPF